MAKIIATVCRGNPYKVVRLVRIDDALIQCPFWATDLDRETALLIAEAINNSNTSTVTDLLMRNKSPKKWKESLHKFIKEKT